MSTENAIAGDQCKNLNNTNHCDASPEIERRELHRLICSTKPYNSPVAATFIGKTVTKESKLKKNCLNEMKNSNSKDSVTNETNKTYTKAEKTRQNQEIIILESSSVSSETGSWESVFADKLSDCKEVCERFLESERNNSISSQKKLEEEASHSKPEDKAHTTNESNGTSHEICATKSNIVKSTQNFFVDLSKLPDTAMPVKKKEDDAKEKKNMFSMFVDFGDTAKTTKDVPVRFTQKSKTKTKTVDLKIETNKKKNFNRKDPVIQEEPVTHSLNLFVKLSDLDKPIAKTSISHENERMVRSTPAKKDTIQTIGSRSMEVISSFHSANALSLSRIFPHLKDALFSKSMPTSLIFNNTDDRNIPEGSEMSSFTSLVSSQSSVGIGIDNNLIDKNDQPVSLTMNCPSQLGQDLLAMFLREIAPDVIVEVSGRRLRAHKCILSSRCPYFAGVLSGGWVESAGNVITLPHFAFGVAHFALCHIYSGVALIPDSISIMELAAIADLLGLEGLKETIMSMLQVKYCHNFHEPCPVCVAGVLECFPVAAAYGLDEIYRQCLAWITAHFHRVWPTRAFAKLPLELVDRCTQEHVVNLAADNVADTVYSCGVILSLLGSSRWADAVVRMCRRLINAAAQFAAPRLCDVLRGLRGTGAAGSGPGSGAAGSGPGADALHHCIITAIELAPPEQLCRAYYLLSALVKERGARAGFPLAPHAGAWHVHCEGVLVRNAPRVVHTAAFERLPAELRARLRELGCISYRAPDVTPAWSRSRPAPGPPPDRLLDVEQTFACFVPYATQPTAPPGCAESVRPRARAAPSVRTTRAQEERVKFNLIKTTQPERAPPRPARGAYERTKPRYMQPRQVHDKPPQKPQPNKAASSSDSSRNSSPAVRPRLPRAPVDLRADVSPLANKYATYIKSKYKAEERTNAQTEKSRSSNSAPVTARNTKIPVYQNVTKPRRTQKTNETKPTSSHMNATKASKAKKVNKVTKESKEKERPAHKSDNLNSNNEPAPHASDIPVMERSGTFLKEKNNDTYIIVDSK